MCWYIVKLPPDPVPPWRQFGWRHCGLRPNFSLNHRVAMYVVCIFVCLSVGAITKHPLPEAVETSD